MEVRGRSQRTFEGGQLVVRMSSIAMLRGRHTVASYHNQRGDGQTRVKAMGYYGRGLWRTPVGSTTAGDRLVHGKPP